MSDASSPTPPTTSAVTLVRTSQAWSQADSAAGFVLRYLAPMRRQMAVLLESTEQADEGLKMIIAHLVSAGFGDHKHDRLRDFLLRSIRSAARKRLKEMPEGKRPDIDFDQLQSKLTRIFQRCNITQHHSIRKHLSPVDELNFAHWDIYVVSP